MEMHDVVDLDNMEMHAVVDLQ